MIFILSLLAAIVHFESAEKKFFSQHGEDGVTLKIFDFVGAKSRYYVEFGAESGEECNTRVLRALGWKGLLMDGSHENLGMNLHKEFVTAENINQLLDKYNVPEEPDLLVIDIDFNDWYVWKAITRRPRVVEIEYNASHRPDIDCVVEYDPKGSWDRTKYFGGSILAMYNLGRAKGYSLVYADTTGTNLFFIRDDLIEECKRKNITFCAINNVAALYRPPQYGKWAGLGGHLVDPKDRPFVTSLELLANQK